jgi:N-acetylglucosaminyldiphosphoundecaprenol N-acetyl-beta-D-mannosaminyltransferase
MSPGLLDASFPVVACAGVPITACSPAQAARAVVQVATSELTSGVDLHLCNAYTLALADADPELRHLLGRATANFPDGQSVVWANRLLHRGQRLPAERVYGPDLLLDVFRLGGSVGLRHYLLGSTPEVLAALQATLRRQFPAARIVGAESPPFRPLTEGEWRERVGRIRACGAQIVWLGLGTPKQDREAARLAAQLPVVVSAVGAAFDFVAGAKRQAPPWLRRRGLEWLFRLACEPRRLWRRYLLGNARFVWAVLRSGPCGRDLAPDGQT